MPMSDSHNCNESAYLAFLASDQSVSSSSRSRDTCLVSRLGAFSRLLPYALITLLCLPVQIMLRQVASRHVWEPFCCWYHRCTLAVLGIRVLEIGCKSQTEPTLYIANHTSYLDIEILGSRIRGTFVAMAQVATWPLFGLLSRLQDSVFIDRRVTSILAQHRLLTERFDRYQNLIMFPEGASYTGTHTLPFRSSLFAVAKHKVDGKSLVVQPVSVTYAKLDGLPLGRGLRPHYGWYGNSPIGTHMVAGAGLGRLTLVLEWHPPKTIDDFNGNRKALAAYCESVIKAGMARARSI